MARMILYCCACSAQNFVSEERRAAFLAPPLCWKCGAVLEVPPETGREAGESKRGKAPDKTGEESDE
jgi:hypothetical protein